MSKVFVVKGAFPVKKIFIPMGVLRILNRYSWKTDLPENFWENKLGKNPSENPYVYQKGIPSKEIITFSFSEAKALHQAKAFASGSEDKGDSIVVDKEAQHSLEQFLSAVTKEWRKHQERLNNLFPNSQQKEKLPGNQEAS